MSLLYNRMLSLFRTNTHVRLLFDICEFCIFLPMHAAAFNCVGQPEGHSRIWRRNEKRGSIRTSTLRVTSASLLSTRVDVNVVARAFLTLFMPQSGKQFGNEITNGRILYKYETGLHAML